MATTFHQQILAEGVDPRSFSTKILRNCPQGLLENGNTHWGSWSPLPWECDWALYAATWEDRKVGSIEVGDGFGEEGCMSRMVKGALVLVVSDKLFGNSVTNGIEDIVQELIESNGSKWNSHYGLEEGLGNLYVFEHYPTTSRGSEGLNPYGRFSLVQFDEVRRRMSAGNKNNKQWMIEFSAPQWSKRDLSEFGIEREPRLPDGHVMVEWEGGAFPVAVPECQDDFEGKALDLLYRAWDEGKTVVVNGRRREVCLMDVQQSYLWGVDLPVIGLTPPGKGPSKVEHRKNDQILSLEDIESIKVSGRSEPTISRI